MPRLNSPCGGCTRKAVGCHDRRTCPAWDKYQTEIEARRAVGMAAGAGFDDYRRVHAGCKKRAWTRQALTKEEGWVMNASVMYSHNTDLWATPQDFFDALNEEFHFETDVCALPENAKCARYFTPEQDGLAQEWTGVCWCNPPYGREIGNWVKKAAGFAAAGGDDCHAFASQDRHQMVPRLHLRQGGNSFYQRPLEIRRWKIRRAVSLYGVHF